MTNCDPATGSLIRHCRLPTSFVGDGAYNRPRSQAPSKRARAGEAGKHSYEVQLSGTRSACRSYESTGHLGEGLQRAFAASNLCSWQSKMSNAGLRPAVMYLDGSGKDGNGDVAAKRNRG